MPIAKKITLALFFCFFSLFLFSCSKVLAADSTNATSNTTATSGNFNYIPLEKIPGSDAATSTTIDFYSYVSAVYKFGIWAVGIVAMFMIIWGGYTYITSAGNNSQMETAKRIITDAIVGLILALVSYLLLYIINPDLVKMKKLAPVAGVPAPAAPGVVPPTAAVACSAIPSQVPAQCSDASPDLVNLISCVYQKMNGNVQISSISDSNGGVTCYKDHPNWPQCTTDPQSNCCYHSKGSCHYGGTCLDGSHAVDFSYKPYGSNTNAVTIGDLQSAISGCGGKANPEGNPPHMHASIGTCCTL